MDGQGVSRVRIAIVTARNAPAHARVVHTLRDWGTPADEAHFVCPWHGYEYDMKTGECVSDRKLKLRKYKVVEKGDEVYVLT